MTKKFINILDDVEIDVKPQPSEESSSSMTSESGILTNDTHGECPKCQGTMGKARLASDEEVYYCKNCRVSSPLEASE